MDYRGTTLDAFLVIPADDQALTAKRVHDTSPSTTSLTLFGRGVDDKGNPGDAMTKQHGGGGGFPFVFFSPVAAWNRPDSHFE